MISASSSGGFGCGRNLTERTKESQIIYVRGLSGEFSLTNIFFIHVNTMILFLTVEGSLSPDHISEDKGDSN
jgi:hypothetical protein